MASKPRKYSPELRAEVVKAVVEGGVTPTQAARDFGLVPETVRIWVKRAREEQLGNTPSARDTAARARVTELERRVRELDRADRILIA